MKTALLITTNDKFHKVEYQPGLQFFYEHIKTDLIEVVIPYCLQRIGSLSEDFIMVVDEESLLKANPKLNIFASTFYGSPIFGNVIIVKENGEDFEGLEEKDHEELGKAVAELFYELEKQYKGN